MKHTFALAAAFVAFASAALAADLNLVPYPQEVKMGEGTVPFEYNGDAASCRVGIVSWLYYTRLEAASPWGREWV